MKKLLITALLFTAALTVNAHCGACASDHSHDKAAKAEKSCCGKCGGDKAAKAEKSCCGKCGGDKGVKAEKPTAKKEIPMPKMVCCPAES